MGNLCNKVRELAKFMKEQNYEEATKLLGLDNSNSDLIINLDAESQQNIKEKYGVDIKQVGVSELINFAVKTMLKDDDNTVYADTFSVGELITHIEKNHPENYDKLFTPKALTVDNEEYPFLTITTAAIEEPIIFSWFPNYESQFRAFDILYSHQLESSISPMYTKYLNFRFNLPENNKRLNKTQLNKITKNLHKQIARTNFNYLHAFVEEIMNIELMRVNPSTRFLEDIPEKEIIDKITDITNKYFQNYEQLIINYYTQVVSEISSRVDNSVQFYAEIFSYLSSNMKSIMDELFSVYRNELPTFLVSEKEKFKLGLIEATLPVIEEKMTDYFKQLEARIQERMSSSMNNDITASM